MPCLRLSHGRVTPLAADPEQDYGKGYKYAHSYPGNFIEQEFLPTEISGTKLYDPGDNARENEMRKRMQAFWKEKYGY